MYFKKKKQLYMMSNAPERHARRERERQGQTSAADCLRAKKDCFIIK
jgi:hypothetical protein